MAIDPLMTQSALLEFLKRRFNHTFDHRYIRKLCNKILTQERIEADRTKLEERLVSIRQTHRIARQKLMQILYWDDNPIPGLKTPLPMDVAEAAKNLVMLDIAVLNAEVANGKYKKPIDALVKEFQYDPLPDDVRTVVIAAWTRGGLLPQAAIERIVPKKVTTGA